MYNTYILTKQNSNNIYKLYTNGIQKEVRRLIRICISLMRITLIFVVDYLSLTLSLSRISPLFVIEYQSLTIIKSGEKSPNFYCCISINDYKKVSEYDQEITQSDTADQPMAP